MSESASALERSYMPNFVALEIDMKDKASIYETNIKNETRLLKCTKNEDLGVDRKKLLILDVNGLLLFRKYKATSFPQEFDAVIGEFTIFIRPFAKEFLTWCSDNFIVVIWGTAMKQNLDPLIPLVFGSHQPHLVLTQAECSDTGLQHPTKRGKALLVKDIQQVWQHPNLQAFGFDETNTVLIDDAPYKAAWNPALTAVHPKAWDPYDSENQALNDCLGPEGDIRKFLMLFQECDDSRKAVKACNESKQKNWIVTDSLCEFVSSHVNGQSLAR